MEIWTWERFTRIANSYPTIDKFAILIIFLMVQYIQGCTEYDLREVSQNIDVE